MNRTLTAVLVVHLVILTPLLHSCAGTLAETGCATVTSISCPLIRLHYPDGKVKFKRLMVDNLPKDLKIVEKNLFQTARFVETKKGGTLTFPNGDTVRFRAHKTD